MDLDFQEFCSSATGPFADTNAALELEWNKTLEEVG
jgi:hypothetical protein